MPRPCILLNHWEAYVPFQRTVESIEKQLVSETDLSESQHYIALPYDFLRQSAEKLSSANVILGMNDMISVEPESFTESIALNLLKGTNAQFVLLGKELKRFYLKESPSSINKKIRFALDANLKPFLCIGENPTDFEELKSKEIIKRQLEECLKDLSEESLQKISLIYDTAPKLKNKADLSPQEFNQAYEQCHQLCVEMWGESIAKSIQILCLCPDQTLLKSDFIDKTNCSGFYFRH